MRIAYLTTDEVNKDLALRLAAQWEVMVCPLEPRDPPPDGGFDAVLYDWDHWPADRRPKALTDTLPGPFGPRLALHGYSLEQEQERSLRRSGVLLFDRLDSRTFLELQRAVNHARAIREQQETVALSQKGHDLAAAQADPGALPSEAPGNHPSCCQPGFTGKLDPALPPLQPAQGGQADQPLVTSSGFQSDRRRMVFCNRCLRCREQAEGMAYDFAVVHRQGDESRVIQQETTFICNRCAEARLRRRAWLLLLTGVPVGLLAAGKLFALTARVWLYANPLRRGYFPTVGLLFLVSLGLLVLTGLLVRLAWRHLRWVRGKGYQHERFPDPVVTRMAIELR
jgi:hypothetical protein